MSSYPLRVPDHIMEQARAAAAEDGVSINQMMVAFIAEGLGHRRGLKMMRDRAARADMGAAAVVLDKVPDVAPEPGDEIPPPRRPSHPA
ncbi:hypothetical protein [Salinarimonas sp.]|uniref:hypothetical protein n=1 Tax=Salinarimonas sp. TaxID=2766526 RepID=UPI0032D931E5